MAGKKDSYHFNPIKTDERKLKKRPAPGIL